MPEHQTVTIDGLPTKYRKVGQGKPLLFLHGHRADTRKWLVFIERLAQNYTVYAPELPGQSANTPPFLDRSCAMERYADFCFEFCRVLGLKHIPIVGASMGGIISILLAKKYPQIVQKQILFWTPIDSNFFNHARIKLISSAVAHIAKGRTVFKLWRTFLYSPLVKVFLKIDVKPEEHTLEVINHEIERWREVDLLTWSRSMIDILNTSFNEREQITTPTIAVFSAHDRYFDVEKSIVKYEQIFPQLAVHVVKSKFHVPKGNLTKQFVREYEDIFRIFILYRGHP
ncbi:alpha/beta hydrolase [Patescibacteria group bacterium]|nr:alpha/beta hydrolase [Patescibacteria group bacterium]